MIACELFFSVLVTGAEQRTGSGHRLELHLHDICAIRHNVGDEISFAVAIALEYGAFSGENKQPVHVCFVKHITRLVLQNQIRNMPFIIPLFYRFFFRLW